MRFRLFCKTLGLGLTLFLTACGEQPFKPTPEDIAANNRGVGLMGRFDYSAAAEQFQRLAEQHPEWLDVQVNLAIAILNRQKEGDEAAALDLVEKVLQRDPEHLRAHYVSGLLLLYRGEPGAALPHFRKVAEADPEDAAAAYFLAQCLMQAGGYEEALSGYRRAIEHDAYLRSAYYGAFQAAQRLGRRDEARDLLDAYQRLEKNPRARLVEFKYTRMGPKGVAVAVDLEQKTPPPKPEGPLFAAPLALGVAADWSIPQGGVSLTAADFDGDGLLDLFIPHVLKGPGAVNAVLKGRQEGSFTLDSEHPLAGTEGVNAAAWGDFDNDGLIDVYLLRRGPNQLWRQVEAGRWQDISASSRTGGGDFDSVDGLFFDADHDGDLDLFVVNADGPNELLNNNLNGSFKPIGEERGIAGDGRPSQQILPVDLDQDRDVDLVVINVEPPHEVYLNDRLWNYSPAPGFEAFKAAAVKAAVAGDVDVDGFDELYTLNATGGLQRWRPDAQEQWWADDLGAVSEPAAPRLALADVDGDGALDLLAGDGASWSVYALDSKQTIFSAGDDLLAWSPFLADPASGPGVIGLRSGDGLSVWNPGPGRYQYVALSVSGKEDSAHSMRSNASGIGARITVRVDSRWSAAPAYRSHSGPGQGLQPVAIGLGGAEKLDFVILDWPDGVFQTELDLAGGELHRIAETQRQLSSCPVLFAWNGKKYEFVTDFLGVGGIGYAVGPGEYAEPRPWENLLLPDFLNPENGVYSLKITEPMEESAYIDAARLVYYDLPPGWDMILDERMGILGPAVTGKPRFFQKQMLPRLVLDRNGEDVTEWLMKNDLRAAPVGELDRRFIGRLAQEQVLVLKFPEPLDAAEGEPILIMDGWVEYPYSQTQFAAWQAGAFFAAPTLETKDEQGEWRVLLEQFGYPAGMPRRASVPLPNLPPGTTELRLRTNQEIYWDRLAVVWARPLPNAPRHTLSLKKAEMRKTGFALRTTAAQRLPYYDYERRRPFWDTRYQNGFYTRFGTADELVEAVDDAVAIIGPGEELHLEFAAPTNPPPPGWTRRFVLETHGWAKDMDLFTRDGETIGPLPATGKPVARRDLLHARYNTRYQGGR